MKRSKLLLSLSLLWFAACQSSVTDTDAAIDLSKSAVEDTPINLAPLQETGEEAGIAEALAKVSDSERTDPVEDAKVESAPVAKPGEFEALAESLSYPSVQLRRGETLAHFARWSGVPVEEIATASSVELDGDYPVGLEVILPITSEGMAHVETQRENHRIKRVDGYLASRGGSEKSDFYTVKTGDTAWSIAKSRQGIPVWVLESYNPSVNLDRLRPGQELMVPVLADIVVDAE